jgi:3-dehydroquinate synthase II
MKKVWIEIDAWDKNFITDALEQGADAFIVTDKKYQEKIISLARIDVMVKDQLPGSVRMVTINSKDDEEQIARLPGDTTCIIDTADWKIIPFENLIAVRGNLFANVSTIDDALEAIGILEKGVDGVFVSGCSFDDKLNILKKIKQASGTIGLSQGTIVSVEKLQSGDRVCIDTITNMVDGQGMLVGDYSHGMILVNSEALENPYVAARPFRVNAGAVHCYVMTPGNRTKYLSDLRSGDDVLLVRADGATEVSVVGRIKQEKRPMLRIVIKGAKRQFSVVLQNAETIRVVTPGGASTSVVSLNPGDNVMIYEEEGGRHFGHKIEETIDEK